MRDSRVTKLLAIDYPILQAGMPWISNPELAAAVSNVGGLGITHPTAGMAPDGDVAANLRQNIRQIRRLTGNPFGMCFYLGNPNVAEAIDIAIEEGVRIAVTYGGSPALFTGLLKSNGVSVLHQVSTVRHARGAEAQGVDVVIAEGYEGGGIRGPDENSNLVLIPQIAETISVPIIASGGIMDARGYVAALALGAHGVQMGTRFVATNECIAHPNYKAALMGAIDTGTVIAGRYHQPTRLLRSDAALRLKEATPEAGVDVVSQWDSKMGPAQVRPALLDGELDDNIAYCGAGVGMASEVLDAADVVRNMVEGAQAIINKIR